jgi:hypothetical protein
LKTDLKTWIEETFGNLERKKKTLLVESHVSDVHEDERALGDEEKMRKAEIVIELERTTLVEEVRWRQKSRVLWLKEGIIAQSFSIEWLIPIEEETPLIPC